MTTPLILWLLGDGKPGHENQSLGLAEAMARRLPCQIHRISLAGQRGLIRRIRTALHAATHLPTPDYVIGAGHATHAALLVLSWKFRARSVVLMRPSLPQSWFFRCIVPVHDFNTPPRRQNLILTQGALNRVNPPQTAARHGTLVLLGGPSRSHGWDEMGLLAQLVELDRAGPLKLTDSRRTPADFMTQLATQLPEVEVFPHQQTAPDWLPHALAAAKEVWVTEDSVSMIYEALTSGARVGLLPLPRTTEHTRVRRGLELLREMGYVTLFADWQQTRQLKTAPGTFREADRCAELLVGPPTAKTT